MSLRHPDTDISASCEAWVDTAFTGEVLLQKSQVQSLALKSAAIVRAGLGDGSRTTLQTYLCVIDWFGERRKVTVVENAEGLPLLGVGLLAGHVLLIDYKNLQVSIT